MSGVKRYNHMGHQRPDGDYVLYSDYQILFSNLEASVVLLKSRDKEIRSLEAELAAQREVSMIDFNKRVDAEAELDKLRAEKVILREGLGWLRADLQFDEKYNQCRDKIDEAITAADKVRLNEVR